MNNDNGHFLSAYNVLENTLSDVYIFSFDC